MIAFNESDWSGVLGEIQELYCDSSMIHTQIQKILPHEECKQDQTINKVLQHLDIKYGQSRTEKVEEC